MPGGTFPQPVADLVATLLGIFELKKRPEIIEVLANAHARYEQTNFDNWNGGTYTWALRLEVPVSIYASAESRLSSLEEEMLAQCVYLARLYPNDPLNEITVVPIAPGSSALGRAMAPSETEIRRLWEDGRFRLFLSHASVHKAAVANLKLELQNRGIDGFVAHTDIEPTKEWRDEIELSLRSMHALAALVTPEFHGSYWTDQEVGWALGSNIFVIPIRLGADPYGFAGKFQGVLNASLDKPKPLADSIAKILLGNSQTHGEMRRALVHGFVNSKSYAMTWGTYRLLSGLTDLSAGERAVLLKATAENASIHGAYGFPEEIYKIAGRPPVVAVVEDEQVPF